MNDTMKIIGEMPIEDIAGNDAACQGITDIKNVVLCQEKVQIKYALLMLSYPAKASALSSNAA